MRVAIKGGSTALTDEFKLGGFLGLITNLLTNLIPKIITQIWWKAKAAIILYGVLFLSLTSLGMLWVRYKIDRITIKTEWRSPKVQK